MCAQESENFYKFKSEIEVTIGTTTQMGKAEKLIAEQDQSFRTMKTFLESTADMLEMQLGSLKSTHSEILKDDQKFEAYQDRYDEMVNQLEKAFRALRIQQIKVKAEPVDTEPGSSTDILPKPLASVKKLEDPLEPNNQIVESTSNGLSDLIERILQQHISKSQAGPHNSLVPAGFSRALISYNGYSCRCKTGCDTFRCGCKKRGEPCNNACHFGNSFCFN